MNDEKHPFFTEKQREYFRNATHRWNIKVGAVRSGKTFSDFYLLPKRILACSGQGQIFLIGATQETFARNLLDPMRNIWGDLVGRPSPSGNIRLFGRKCTIVGGANAGQAAKLQGASAEYCYGDEITTWNEEVFEMLKSRLDRENSCFDGTCNPTHPGHYFKRFLDSGADIYCQTYTLDDNPHLPATFRAQLKKEYTGAAYERYVLGRWCAAEGAIYSDFSANPQKYLISDDDAANLRGGELLFGVDFGGNRSASAISALWTGKIGDETHVVSLASRRFKGRFSPETLSELLLRFAEATLARWRQTGVPIAMYCDNAEPVLIRGVRRYFEMHAVAPELLPVRAARKSPIQTRIRTTLALMASNRYHLTADCASLASAFSTARWKENSSGDIRLDDFSSDIDSLDAFEYALERIRL